MKNIKILSAGLILAFLISCDKVKNPIVPKNTAVGSVFVVKDNSAVSSTKKTLIEDYTGMRCPNCKSAADNLKTMAAASGGTIIAIACHANFYAKPVAVTYTADYRCDASEDWFADFGIVSNPTGVINKKNYNGNGLLLSSTAWSTVLDIAKNDPLLIKVDVTTKYDTTASALNVSVKGTFKAAMPDSLNVTVALYEDGIHGVQDDNGQEFEYEFEHVLRGTLNGSFGTLLKAGPSANNDTVRVEFNNFDLKGMKLTKGLGVTNPININVNDKNVSVIVIVSKRSNKEVLQVEKVKIR